MGNEKMNAEKRTQDDSMSSMYAQEMPNATTIAALMEVEEMSERPEKYPLYTDINKLMKDLLTENSK